MIENTTRFSCSREFEFVSVLLRVVFVVNLVSKTNVFLRVDVFVFVILLVGLYSYTFSCYIILGGLFSRKFMGCYFFKYLLSRSCFFRV